MPAASTSRLSVQVSGFEDICLLTQSCRLLCDFCSSGQRFACGFLQIPPRGGHPCRPANDSPCRVRMGLSPTSECALPGAQKETPRRAAREQVVVGVDKLSVGNYGRRKLIEIGVQKILDASIVCQLEHPPKLRFAKAAESIERRSIIF